MPFRTHDRQYDLVVFGATGYTGIETAEHIAAALPTNLKWAVAGRTETKLKALVSDLRKLNPDRIQPAIEICNLDDEDLQALAKKSFSLISTVGPYFQYGELAFKACAENGTHYFDVTGEVPWVRKMIIKYEDAAKASGAMMFPQLGLESAPPDLLVWALAQTNKQELAANTGAVTISIHVLDALPSGGTLATVLGLSSAFKLADLRASFEPYALSPVPNTKKIPSDTLLQKIFGVRHIPELGTLTTSLAGTTDAAISGRSWGLLQSLPGRKKQTYGPNFSHKGLFRVSNWIEGVLVHWGLAIGIIIISTPLRALIRMLIYQPGEGPDREKAKKHYVELRGKAIPDAKSNSDKIAFGKIYYHGSMYQMSGMLTSQGALTLLEEDVNLPGGIFTAACLGQPFVDRTDKQGLKLETKMITPGSSP